MNLQQIEKWREGAKLEAKSAAGGVPKSMWETYSSFANTDGGLIILGASERPDHSLVLHGVNDPELLVKAIWDTPEQYKLSHRIRVRGG